MTIDVRIPHLLVANAPREQVLILETSDTELATYEPKQTGHSIEFRRLRMTDPFDLKEDVSLVTGASTGMGRCMAVLLAERGAAVAVAARGTDRLAKLCDEIAGAGGHGFAVTLDMSDVKSFGQIVDAVETALGPISILINNAGIA